MLCIYISKVRYMISYRAPTACPKWNEGMDEDIAVLHWLSKNAGLTSECITEVIELFAWWWLENNTHSMTWNEAAKQVMWPPPRPAKAVELTTALSSSKFNQYTLLTWLTDAEAQSKPLDNAMVIHEPVKPVAGSSRHPDNEDIVDGELRY